MTVYVFMKDGMSYVGQFHSVSAATTYCTEKSISDSVFYMEEVPAVDYISRITYVDSVCVYNNKTYWATTAWSDNVVDNFSSHTVTDWMGNSVDKARFSEELYSNANRINAVDGQPGETALNQVVGNELISLLMSEFSKTTVSSVSTADIAAKCGTIGTYLALGSFYLAEAYLSAMSTDEFFTTERIAKYLAMMKSADAFTYAS